MYSLWGSTEGHMTPDPKDAALRERVRKAIAAKITSVPYSAHCTVSARVETISDAVLAAIAEPAPTPKPPRVELSGGAYATWDGSRFIVRYSGTASPLRYMYESAANVVAECVYSPSQRDAKHAELMALKGQGEPVVDMIGGWRTAAMLAGEALADSGPHNYYKMTPAEWNVWAITTIRTLTAAPPRAPQKVEAWMNVLYDGTHFVWTREDWARDFAKRYPVSKNWREVATPLVRGDEVKS